MPAERMHPKLLPAVAPHPFPQILCAVDGSRCATHAIEQALTLAGSEARLTFLSVSDSRGLGLARMASLSMRAADEILERARETARGAGIDAETRPRHGDDPRREIVAAARGHDLLVLGTHGRRRPAGFLIGSISMAALHHSHVPVLVARAVAEPAVFPRDILLATDGSPAMDAVVAITGRLAQRHDARVVLGAGRARTVMSAFDRFTSQGRRR